MKWSEVLESFKQKDERIAELEKELARSNKVSSYCINQIHDTSKLKYIMQLSRDLDKIKQVEGK